MGTPEFEDVMNNAIFQVKFWGVRGSIPVSGPQFQRYGGNTSCIEIRCGDHCLIFDAGSGIREAGLFLVESGVSHADLFFTHYHYDHIIGLPFFKALYNRAIHLSLWSGHLFDQMKTREMVERFIHPPWFPIKSDICQASLDFRDFQTGDILAPHPGLLIRTAMLNHPGGAVGYRIEWNGRAVALIYDIEHVPGTLDPVSLDLMKDADLVVYDCTYTEAEMAQFAGYGHSSWEQGIKLAQEAGAKRFALFHHSPSRTDRDIERLEKAAQSVMSGAFAAYDGQLVEL